MLAILGIESNLLSLLLCVVLILSLRTKAINAKREYKIVLIMAHLMSIIFICGTVIDICLPFDNISSIIITSIFYHFYLIMSSVIPLLFFALFYTKFVKSFSPLVSLLIAIPFLFNIVLVLTNCFTGYLFDINNHAIHYHGILMPFFIICCYFYVIASLTLIILNHRKADSKQVIKFFAIILTPILGTFAQYTIGGDNLVWQCCVISLYYYYINILRDKANLDYLSGLYNRMQADEFIDNKIKHVSNQKTFSGMMIDVNNFKKINDTYGHAEGDKAIERVALILKHNVFKHDFVARQGGDEFLIVFQTDSYEELTRIADRLNRAFDRFNSTNKLPYKLTISMGYDIYIKSSKMSRKNFLHHLDELMYEDKHCKKKASAC